MRSCLSWLLVSGLYLLLVGCGSAPPAPIEDHSGQSDRRSTIGRSASVSTHNVASRQNYVVLTGDTLYSIAFRYGLDFRRFAAANAISAPYTIFPGQKLVLREAEPVIARSPTAVSPPASTSDSIASKSNSSQASSNNSSKVTSSTSTPPAAASAKTKATPKAVSKPAPKPATNSTTKPRATPNTASDVAVSRWRWPVKGQLSRRFDGELHKGIDIRGARGDAVTATAGGRVVYAGSGIAGYGLMLILRHNEEYLSAYGHNDSLLVAEGDTVRAGQTIATRGSSGTDSVKLHFEIRRRGRPVDPLGLLPKR